MKIPKPSINSLFFLETADYTAFIFYLHHIDKIYGYTSVSGALIFAMSYFARLIGVLILFFFPTYFCRKGVKQTLKSMSVVSLLIAVSALMSSGYILLPFLRLFQGIVYSFTFPVTLMSIKKSGNALRMVFPYGAAGILISYALLSLSTHGLLTYKISFIVFFLVFSILCILASYNFAAFSFKDTLLPQEKKMKNSSYGGVLYLSLYSLSTNLAFMSILLFFKNENKDITYLIIYVLLLIISSTIKVFNIILIASSTMMSFILFLPYFDIVSDNIAVLASIPFLVYLVSCLPDKMRGFFSGEKTISYIGLSYGIGAAFSGIIISLVLNECFDKIFILISILFFLLSAVGFIYGNLRSEY